MTAWWGPGVHIDGVRNCGCTCYRPYAGRSGGGKKKDHPAEGVYALRVIRAVSRRVPGRPDVRRACSARFACCLQPCPWRLGNVPRVARVLQLTPFFVDRQDLAMAITLSSTAAPRTIQA